MAFNYNQYQSDNFQHQGPGFYPCQGTPLDNITNGPGFRQDPVGHYREHPPYREHQPHYNEPYDNHWRPNKRSPVRNERYQNGIRVLDYYKGNVFVPSTDRKHRNNQRSPLKSDTRKESTRTIRDRNSSQSPDKHKPSSGSIGDAISPKRLDTKRDRKGSRRPVRMDHRARDDNRRNSRYGRRSTEKRKPEHSSRNTKRRRNKCPYESISSESLSNSTVSSPDRESSRDSTSKETESRHEREKVPMSKTSNINVYSPHKDSNHRNSTVYSNVKYNQDIDQRNIVKSSYHRPSADLCRTTKGQSTELCKETKGQSTELCKETKGPSADLCKTTKGPSTELCKETEVPSADLCKTTKGHSTELCKETKGPSADLCKTTKGQSTELCKETKGPSADLCKTTKDHERKRRYSDTIIKQSVPPKSRDAKNETKEKADKNNNNLKMDLNERIITVMESDDTATLKITVSEKKDLVSSTESSAKKGKINEYETTGRRANENENIDTSGDKEFLKRLVQTIDGNKSSVNNILSVTSKPPLKDVQTESLDQEKASPNHETKNDSEDKANRSDNVSPSYEVSPTCERFKSAKKVSGTDSKHDGITVIPTEVVSGDLYSYEPEKAKVLSKTLDTVAKRYKLATVLSNFLFKRKSVDLLEPGVHQGKDVHVCSEPRLASEPIQDSSKCEKQKDKIVGLKGDNKNLVNSIKKQSNIAPENTELNRAKDDDSNIINSEFPIVSTAVSSKDESHSKNSEVGYFSSKQKLKPNLKKAVVLVEKLRISSERVGASHEKSNDQTVQLNRDTEQSQLNKDTEQSPLFNKFKRRVSRIKSNDTTKVVTELKNVKERLYTSPVKKRQTLHSSSLKINLKKVCNGSAFTVSKKNKEIENLQNSKKAMGQCKVVTKSSHINVEKEKEMHTENKLLDKNVDEVRIPNDRSDCIVDKDSTDSPETANCDNFAMIEEDDIDYDDIQMIDFDGSEKLTDEPKAFVPLDTSNVKSTLNTQPPEINGANSGVKELPMIKTRTCSGDRTFGRDLIHSNPNVILDTLLSVDELEDEELVKFCDDRLFLHNKHSEQYKRKRFGTILSKAREGFQCSPIPSLDCSDASQVDKVKHSEAVTTVGKSSSESNDDVLQTSPIKVKVKGRRKADKKKMKAKKSMWIQEAKKNIKTPPKTSAGTTSETNEQVVTNNANKKDQSNESQKQYKEDTDIVILPESTEFAKIGRKLYDRGFEVTHCKVLIDDEIVVTKAHLIPKRLYANSNVDSKKMGKCLLCRVCSMCFTPLDFTVHHDKKEVFEKLNHQDCQEMSYVINETAPADVKQVFKNFQKFFHDQRK